MLTLLQAFFAFYVNLWYTKIGDYMIENQYVKEFNKYKKYKPSDSDVSYLRSDLYFFSNNLKVFFEKLKEQNIDKKNIIHIIHDICQNCSATRFVDSLLYETQAIDAILKNPSIIDNITPTIKNAKVREVLHTANYSRSQKLEIENAIADIKEMETLGPKYKVNEHELIKKLPENTASKLKDFLKFYKSLLAEPNQKAKIQLYLKSRKSTIEHLIRKEQTRSLTFIGGFFRILGLSATYMDSYNKSKDKFGFSELNYDFSEAPSKKSIGFLETFSEEYLNTLSVRDLCFLTSHWSNRFSKECVRLSNYFSAVNSLNLWDKLTKDNPDFSDIPEEALQAVLIKSKYLSDLTRESFSIHSTSVISSQLQKGTQADVPFEKSFNTFYQKIRNSVNKGYCDFFESKGLQENNFEKDISFTFSIINAEMIGYKRKDSTLIPLVQSLLKDPHFKNWGIIRNELVDENFVDSVTTNKNKVLLAFDIKGFNMPFRFHIEKDTLMDILKSTNQNYLIPEYQGADDFYINNEVVPSNIIMPIAKEHKKTIMENAKKEGPLKNFWGHKYFLMNEKLPSHFVETKQLSKSKSETVRKPIIFTDLKTGERFIEEKKGEFKPFMENQK